jgi:hypothetical protein
MMATENDVTFEVDLSSAIQVLSESMVKLERQHAVLQAELLLERAVTKRLQAQDQEKDAKIKLLVKLLDSHELRIAALEAKKPAAPHGGTFDA